MTDQTRGMENAVKREPSAERSRLDFGLRRQFRRHRRPSLWVLVLAVGVAAALVTVTLAAILYRSAERRTVTNETFVQHTEIMSLTYEARAGALAEGGALATFVLLRDPAWVEVFAQERENVDKALRGVREALPTSDHERIDSLIEEHETLATQFQSVFDALGQGDEQDAVAATAGANIEERSASFLARLNEGVERARGDLAVAEREDRAAQMWSFRVSLGVIMTWGFTIVALALAAMQWVVLPLRRASAATREIAAGDLSVRVPHAGPAELARLGSDVNGLTDALMKRSEELNSYLALNLEARSRELEATQQRFEALVRHGSDLVTVIEADGTITYQSPSVLRILGLSDEHVVGRKLYDLVHPGDTPALIAFMTEVTRANEDVSTVALRLCTKDGAWRDAEVAGTDRRSDPAVRGIVLNIRDVTERVALEAQLRYHALHDPLTGLANRVRFSDRLEHALERRSGDDDVAVLALDLYDLKSVNESLGQDVGNTILVEIAARLSKVIGPQDTVARFERDEFAILLEDLTSADQARETAERILTVVAAPLSLDGMEIVIRASAGLAIAAADVVDPNAVLHDADLALYEAKASKNNRIAQFNPIMRRAAVERLELLRDLDRALERGQLILEYQPTVQLATGVMVGVEALVRWQHPSRGLLQPDAFVPLAEETGAISAIGAFVLRTACQQARAWRDQFGGAALSMNVNVSVHQLLDSGFVDLVNEALAAADLDSESLVLEITESVMLDNQDATKVALQQLKQSGVRLAIDDFGTGYSSLRYLREYPFDIIKIDKSFLADGAKSDRALERAIVELGKSLKLEIIAEGIETREQLNRLKELECELGQGYYFARPMGPDELEALLRSGLAERNRLAAAALNGSTHPAPLKRAG